MTTFIFPGQGSQVKGMGGTLFKFRRSRCVSDNGICWCATLTTYLRMARDVVTLIHLGWTIYARGVFVVL